MAWWSRPDEPAALNPPHIERNFIEENKEALKGKKPFELELNGLSAKRKSLTRST